MSIERVLDPEVTTLCNNAICVYYVHAICCPLCPLWDGGIGAGARALGYFCSGIIVVTKLESSKVKGKPIGQFKTKKSHNYIQYLHLVPYSYKPREGHFITHFLQLVFWVEINIYFG